MKAQTANYELVPAATLGEVLARLAAEPGVYRPLAGGTDLMVVFAGGKLAHTRFVDVWGLSELRGITVADDAVTLGALSTYSEVQAHALLAGEFPMLCQAASETGGWAIQNRGTLGGNIVNASPAADSPPALLAYGAEIELRSTRGARWIPYSSFHTGYKTTVLAQDELVTRVRIPRLTAAEQGRRVTFYRKVGPRKAQAISKVCFAACVDVAGGQATTVRIALGGVAPTVALCPATARALEGSSLDDAASARALAAFATEIAPIDDIRSNVRYRRRVAENLLGELVRKVRQHVGLDTQAR